MKEENIIASLGSRRNCNDSAFSVRKEIDTWQLSYIVFCKGPKESFEGIEDFFVQLLDEESKDYLEGKKTLGFYFEEIEAKKIYEAIERGKQDLRGYYPGSGYEEWFQIDGEVIQGFESFFDSSCLIPNCSYPLESYIMETELEYCFYVLHHES